MRFPKHSLQLSANALVSLNWWLEHVLTQERERNYYTDLLLMVIAKLWEKKVYPKTGAVQDITKVKLDEMQTLALSMSFYCYDILDAPSLMHQANLHSIFQDLPPLRYDQEQRFLPPILVTDE